MNFVYFLIIFEMNCIMPKLIYSDNLLFDDIRNYTDFLFAIEYCIKYSKQETLMKILNHFQNYTNNLRHNKKIISRRYNISYERLFIEYSFYMKNQQIAQSMLDLFEYSLNIHVYTDIFD